MKKKIICIITIAEAKRILEEYGFQTSEVHIRAMIECGAYWWGKCCVRGKNRTFEVYKPQLMRWIDEVSEEVDSA